MPTLFLERRAVRALIRMADVINVVEEAFGMCGEGRGKMPAKTYLSLEHGNFRAMPAAVLECAGGKVVRVQPEDLFGGAPSMQKAVDTYESGCQD